MLQPLLVVVQIHVHTCFKLYSQTINIIWFGGNGLQDLYLVQIFKMV